MVSINILIFTYKQQDLIIRAVESILSQREFGLKNIIISDDCSPDHTWDVVCNYKEKYPDIIEAHRNESNLGVYGNWNQMISMKGDADIYYILAGDDALCDGILKQVQLKVEKEKINPKAAVALYYDWKCIRPDGTETVSYNNRNVYKIKDVFGLKLRDRISIRSCFVTYGLMNKYKLVDVNHGISLSETMADLQYSYIADRNYYESFVGSIYYSGIGVSVGLFSKDYYKESIESWERLPQYYHFNKKDFAWIQYRKSKDLYCIAPSLCNFFKILYYYMKGEKFVGWNCKLKTIYNICKFGIKVLINRHLENGCCFVK